MAVDVVIAVLIVLGIFAMVRRTKDEKMNPDKYKRKKVKAQKEE